jgi:hypothetical protein
MVRRLSMLCVSVCLFAFGQEAEAPAAAPAKPTARSGPSAPQEIKPYEKVITSEAKSDPGIFSVHRVKEKVYYEIPGAELGKEFLWVSQIRKTTQGVGYGGQMLNNRVVRWERHNNRVLLRGVSYEVVADPKLSIAQAVEAANNSPILMAFNIEAFGKNDAPVIDVTRLFISEVAEFSARARLRARGFDSSRSFIEKVKAFPSNINVQVSHTFTSPIDPPPAGPPAPPSPPSPFRPPSMQPGSATVLMHYSMVKLPEQPMKPRLADYRVGYFSVQQTDYGVEEHRAPRRTYITRWRLEKKDPSAEVSEPVKPIVYYIDPATPPKWVPYIRRGIEAWQKAFEKAGFRKAIVAKDAPTPAEDPEWSPEDARYSVVRWLPSTIENAMGPHVHDPRTGEILESDIQMYHNVMNLLRSWYFTQVAPLDPRARTMPLPDDLMGQLIEHVTAHEVGHTLGFQHNMKSSSTYPFEKVRDRAWVKKMGHTPSIMDYSRFNYVAQPEDRIDVEDLIPRVGPYDEFATMWGYKPIPDASTPDDEKKTLNEWARLQDETPWLRFSTRKSMGSDPGELTESVGDADAVAATRLGLKNLERVMTMLIPATSTKQGEPFEDLEELYNRTLGQWVREMNHVASIVGGYRSQQKHVGQIGVLFSPVPKQKQAEAVQFLNENAFKTPVFALNSEVLRRIEPAGSIGRINSAQRAVLTNLLDGTRFNRLVEQEASEGASAYAPGQFLADLRKGIFSELAATAPKVDAWRRGLQRTYLLVVGDKLNGRSPVTDDQRAWLRGELRSLQAEVGRASARVADRATRVHAEDLRTEIAKILDPKFAAPSGTLVAISARPSVDSLDCWHDYESDLLH